jgi:hypothetical protein
VLTGDNEKQGRWAMMGAGFGVEHAFFKVLPAGFFPHYNDWFYLLMPLMHGYLL